MIDKELETRMQMAQDVTSMVLALRRKVNIKVRQPLQCIMIPVVDEEQRAHIEAVKALIMNEVNVKEIKFVDGAAGVLVKKVKCDFKKLGPKFGKQMKLWLLPWPECLRRLSLNWRRTVPIRSS